MTIETTQVLPGQRIVHPEFGEGVVVEITQNGYARAFFGVGEKQIPLSSLSPLVSRAERILRNVAPGTPGAGSPLRTTSAVLPGTTDLTMLPPVAGVTPGPSRYPMYAVVPALLIVGDVVCTRYAPSITPAGESPARAASCNTPVGVHSQTL